MSTLVFSSLLFFASLARGLTVNVHPGQSAADIVSALGEALGPRHRHLSDAGVLSVVGLAEPIRFQISADLDEATRHELTLQILAVYEGKTTPVRVDLAGVEVLIDGASDFETLYGRFSRAMDRKMDRIREAGRPTRALPDHRSLHAEARRAVDELTEECLKALGLPRR